MHMYIYMYLKDEFFKTFFLSDHVVVLRPGGYPVAINTSAKENEETKQVQYIEDIEATEGNQM